MLDENSRRDVPVQPMKSVAFVMGKSYIATKVDSVSSESHEDFMRWQSLIDLSETAFSMERPLKRGWFITATESELWLIHSVRVNLQEHLWLPLTQEAHKTTSVTDWQCSPVARETWTAHPVH